VAGGGEAAAPGLGKEVCEDTEEVAAVDGPGEAGEGVGVVGFSQGALMAALLVAQGHPSSSLRFALLVCSGDAHDAAAVAHMSTGGGGGGGGGATRLAGADGRDGAGGGRRPCGALGAMSVLSVIGDADPLVSVADCRALADRLAARLAQNAGGAAAGEEAAAAAAGGAAGGAVEEIGDRAVPVSATVAAAVAWQGAVTTGAAAGITAGTAAGTAGGRASFLVVSGGHGLPPNRDMASIKAFVAQAMKSRTFA
jgi:hypothetical protein